MVICLERGADLHMAQLMPLPFTVSGFIGIQIGFTFLVPAHLGSPGHRAVKRVCVCVCVCVLRSSKCRDEIFEVQISGQSSRGKYPFCRFLNFLIAQCIRFWGTQEMQWYKG